jgi:pimeloyl-ACP methyl ester carboxylesterase
MTNLSRRHVLTAAVAGLTGVAVASPARAAAPVVEATYAAAGPWPHATFTVGTEFVVTYPVGAGRQPVITWGNGTNATPALYEGVMRHLASWGFIVVASTSTATASGVEMLAGVQYVRDRDTDPSSPLYGRVDAARIAAAGHSQGAGGAARATLNTTGLISTVVPINAPDPFWIPDAEEIDLSAVTVPVLLLSGVKDYFISPPQTLTAYYNNIPGAVARASLKAGDHNTIQRTGGGYLGYLAAWMRWQLSADGYAGSAFRGTQPELLGNPAWANQAAKNLG